MAKKPRTQPQLSPAVRLSGLGPRVTRLITHDLSDAHTVQAELTRLTEGLKPASFLPILVNACAGASDDQRARLEQPIGTWLRDQGLIELLHDLEAKHVFAGPARQLARAWLAAAGQSLEPLLEPVIEDLVIRAYQVGGEADDSQTSVTLFWYEDMRRRRVHSASFLIDYEPPWEGALKDLAYDNFRDADSATRRFMSVWTKGYAMPRQIDVSSFARLVWTALRQSQAQDIKLPADFIAAAPVVLPMLRALPTHPEAPALDEDELKVLMTSGRSPEAIWQQEQLFGYQKRMPDGTIIHILRPRDEDF